MSTVLYVTNMVSDSIAQPGVVTVFALHQMLSCKQKTFLSLFLAPSGSFSQNLDEHLFKPVVLPLLRILFPDSFIFFLLNPAFHLRQCN